MTVRGISYVVGNCSQYIWNNSLQQQAEEGSLYYPVNEKYFEDGGTFRRELSMKVKVRSPIS